MRKTLTQALLAAFCAILARGTFAAHVEGGGMMQIASKISMWSGTRTPTAKNYVQDGLVAMWDGIENAGWGVHDASATTWNTLINGAGIPLPSYSGGSLAFSDNALRLSTTTGGAFGAINAGYAVATGQGDFTISTTATFRMSTGPSGTAGVADLFGSVRPMRISTTGELTGFISGVSNTGTLSILGGMVSVVSDIVVDRANSISYFYINGELAKTAAAVPGATTSSNLRVFYCPTGGWGANQTIDLHNVRQYSRALTAAEIAANYAIDKERFGLT